MSIRDRYHVENTPLREKGYSYCLSGINIMLRIQRMVTLLFIRDKYPVENTPFKRYRLLVVFLNKNYRVVFKKFFPWGIMSNL